MLTFPRTQLKYNLPSLTQSLISKIRFALANLKYTAKMYSVYNNTHSSIDTGHFLNEDIASKIKSSLSVVNTLSITYKNTSRDIYIYTPSSMKITQKFINSIAQRILLFCELLNNANIPKITIYMLDLPKRISFLNEMTSSVLPYNFDTRIINSGYHAITTSQIVLFRSEEILKVLLHELIHYHKLDYYYAELGLTSEVENMITRHYSLPPNSNEYIWNEAKAEALAILLYHILEDSNYESIVRSLKCEIDWNMFQIAKLLLLTTKDIMLDKKFNGIANGKYLSKFKQTTCVFNYFITKTLLLLQDTNLLDRNQLDTYIMIFTNDKLLTKGVKYYIHSICRIMRNRTSNKIQTRKRINKMTIDNLLNSMRMSYDFKVKL